MATNYSEFATTQANLLADIRTAILASTDWARPNAAGKPSLYKATTTRGADMIIDLEHAAQALNGLTAAFWRVHDGTSGTDSLVRYLYYKSATTALVSTSPLYCRVSAGKEHLYIEVEGPRPGDTGAQSTTYGSVRTYVFISDLVPYHSEDTTPCVVAGGGQNTATPYALVTSSSHQCYVSRNQGATQVWTNGKLASLDFPDGPGDATAVNPQRQCSIDGKYYLAPYVFFDDQQGIRGRLARFHFAGWNETTVFESYPVMGGTVSQDGVNYRLVAPAKSDGTSNAVWAAFGSVANTTSGALRSPIVAVPQ